MIAAIIRRDCARGWAGGAAAMPVIFVLMVATLVPLLQSEIVEPLIEAVTALRAQSRSTRCWFSACCRYLAGSCR